MLRHLSRTVRTATPSTIREVNRSIILNLIRLHQPVSRVKLSDLSGIVRSNVSDIVDQLIAQHWLTEERATPRGQGRVPMMLNLDPNSFWVLGASVRSVKTTVALAGLTGEVCRSLTFPTPSKPDELVRKLAESVEEIGRGQVGNSSTKFEGLGISVPGLVSSHDGEILWLPTLPEYSGFNMAAELETWVGFPVAVENDDNLVALAEMWLDETADLSDFIVLSVGEAGIGGGIVLNRELYRGHNTSFVCEIGHTVIDPTGPKCSCGRQGCLQLYVCNRATWHRYDPRAEFEASRFQGLVRMAQQGNPKALKAFDETARYLSMGISNLFLILNPELVILAGEIMKVPDVVRQTSEQIFSTTQLKVPIRPARLDIEQLYLHGVICLALERAFAQPKLGW